MPLLWPHLAYLLQHLISGLAGFIIATNLNTDSQAAINQPVIDQPTSSFDVVTNLEQDVPSRLELQPLIPTEKSATVKAVETVLPAVVTVLNQQGRFGGGSGSGFFINSGGHVVTNYHVVEGATDLSVIYAQGGTAPARSDWHCTRF